jgi:hypothetical protein
MLRRVCRWLEGEVNEVKDSELGSSGCAAEDLGGWLRP